MTTVFSVLIKINPNIFFLLLLLATRFSVCVHVCSTENSEKKGKSQLTGSFRCQVTNIAGVHMTVFSVPHVQLYYAHIYFSFLRELAHTLLTFTPARCVEPKHSPLRLSYSSGLFPSFFGSKYSLENHLWEWFCSYNIPISTFSWPTETSPPALMTPPPQFSIHTSNHNLSFSASWHQQCFHPQPQPPDRSPIWG